MPAPQIIVEQLVKTYHVAARAPGPPAIVGWLAPLVGPVFLVLCLQIWRIGVRHYRSTGS